ncbi:MAG: hypothetical protein OHK0022_44050 [Roseiflexaceae bacterium]
MADVSPQPAVDVGALLEALRAEVRARRLSQAQPEDSPLMRDLQRSLDEIELHRVVSAHWPLTGRTLPEKAVALVNKLVRRGLRWYINPIVEQQNAYNDAVARALRLLAEAYADLQTQTGDQTPQAPALPDHAPAPSPQSPAPSLKPQASSLTDLVAQRAAQEPPARFPDLELRAVEPQLRLRQEVNAHWPLEGRTPFERVAALAHKLMRRYLRWLINPIVEQQNAANAAITLALLHMFRLDGEQRARLAEARSKKAKGKNQKTAANMQP